MLLAIAIATSITVFPRTATGGINDDVVCCTLKGCEAPSDNDVHLIDQGTYLPNWTCTDSSLPSEGVSFQLVSRMGTLKCYPRFTDPNITLTIVDVNEYGQWSTETGDGSSRVGGCGKVSNDDGCTKYSNL